MSDLNIININSNNKINKINVNIKNIYSIFISSYIAYFVPNIWPIIILFDSSNKTSLYYSLFIQNKILLLDLGHQIQTIDLKIELLSTNTTNTTNMFIILDCIYDISKLLKFIETNFQNQIMNISKIYTILNYYNIDENKLKESYDILSKMEFLNIISPSIFSKLNYQYIDICLYKELDQNKLLNTFVIPDDFALNRFKEITNYFITQSVTDYYKIYFLKNKLDNAYMYVSKWSYFSNDLIKFINSLDSFDNLINYQIINNGSLVCQNYMEDIQMNIFLTHYPIIYVSNYNNTLLIDNYTMTSYNYQKKLSLLTNDKININYLTDSIYKINGTTFNPELKIINLDQESNIYSLKLSTTTNTYDINLSMYLFRSDKVVQSTEPIDQSTEPIDQSTEPIGQSTEPIDKSTEQVIIKMDIIDNLDTYCVYIYLQLKFNKLKEIPREYLKISDFFIQLLIISKKQFNLKRYIILNDELLIDSDIDINIWYNPYINKGDYLSQIFFNDLNVIYNKMG